MSDTTKNEVQDHNGGGNSKYSKFDKDWINIAYLLTASLLVWVFTSIFGMFSPTIVKSEKGSIPIEVSVVVKPTVVREMDADGHVVRTRIEMPDVDADVKNWVTALTPGLNQAVQDATKDQVDGIEKRVGDIWSSVQGIGLISAIIGILITVMVLYFSFQNSEAINNAKKELFSGANEEVNKKLPSMLEAELVKKLPGELTTRLPSLLDPELAKKLPGELTNRLPSLLDTELVQKLPGELTKRLPSMLDTELAKKLPGELNKRLPSLLDTELAKKLPGELNKRLPSLLDDELVKKLPDELNGRLNILVPIEVNKIIGPEKILKSIRSEKFQLFCDYVCEAIKTCPGEGDGSPKDDQIVIKISEADNLAEINQNGEGSKNQKSDNQMVIPAQPNQLDKS